MEDNKDKINEENKQCNCGEKSGGCNCESGECGCESKDCDCKKEQAAGVNDDNVGVNDDNVGANDDNVGANACGAQDKDELTLVKEKVKDWEDKYKRLLAEFDNFRKRSEKESAQMCDIGASVVLTKILPIVDNIERALQNIPEDIKGNAFVEGIDKTYKQIIKTFEEMDVKPIESVGKAFDANLHNAVMTDENAEGEVDTITEELQKGWTYKDQVLRHSMVKVKK